MYGGREGGNEGQKEGGKEGRKETLRCTENVCLHVLYID